MHQTITGSYRHSIRQVIWKESIKQLGYFNLNLKLMGGGGGGGGVSISYTK